MTDAERKQFINEYCRNVGNIKIKCDDCKFVEDCVDYGWEGCKKFTQKQPHTNEEWLKQCNTEQLAEELLAWWVDGADTYTQFGLFQHEIDGAKEKIMKWLKQPHKPIS